MNNKETDLMSLFLRKFPECKDIITSDEFKTNFVTDRSLKTFLLLNSYNEQLSRETDTDLFFKNLNTEKVSIAHITDSETYGSSIEFAPYYGYCYTTLNSEHSNEAIAFSICNSHFTCVRLNEMGLFIEKFIEKWFIETEFYDIEAIKNIFSRSYYSLYDNNKIIYKLLDDLKSSVEDLSISINKKYDLRPDMIIEYGGAICGANTYAVFKKNNLTLDRGMVSLNNYEFYAEYLNFMKEQGYYSDDNKNNLIRIRNK